MPSNDRNKKYAAVIETARAWPETLSEEEVVGIAQRLKEAFEKDMPVPEPSREA